MDKNTNLSISRIFTYLAFISLKEAIFLGTIFFPGTNSNVFCWSDHHIIISRSNATHTHSTQKITHLFFSLTFWVCSRKWHQIIKKVKQMWCKLTCLFNIYRLVSGEEWEIPNATFFLKDCYYWLFFITSAMPPYRTAPHHRHLNSHSFTL